jgi:hypothetical protein
MEEVPTPVEPTPAPATVPATGSDKKAFAIASLVLGIINLCSWFLPICGGPLALIGIVLGVVGLNSSKRGMAIAGIVLSGIGILLVLINAVAGALMAPMIQQILSGASY